MDRNDIIQDLHKCCEGSFVSGDRVILPSVNVAVMPEVYQLKDNLATLGYHLYSPEWKNEIFEVSSALGKDQKAAVGMAQGGFLFGILEAVQAMMNDINAREADSDFLGLHRWKLYLGNIVAIGKEVPADIQLYWHVLKDEILKRIGNQEICYIKIYAANAGNDGYVTGECRINDTKIDSLSKIVEDMAKAWHNKEFASHKQFFLLRQDRETLWDYPYTHAEIDDAVEKALMLYEKVLHDGKQEYYLPALAEFLGDRTLAQDIVNFVPEICTELALQEVRFSEAVKIEVRGNLFTFYKTQLADYYPIANAVSKALDKGVVSKKTFESLLYASAGFDAVQKALADGSKPEHLVLTDMIFQVSDDYIVR